MADSSTIQQLQDRLKQARDAGDTAKMEELVGLIEELSTPRKETPEEVSPYPFAALGGFLGFGKGMADVGADVVGSVRSLQELPSTIQQTVQAAIPPQGSVPSPTQQERIFLGNIKDQGVTGRQSMTGFNLATQQQKENAIKQAEAVAALKKQGVITGENIPSAGPVSRGGIALPSTTLLEEAQPVTKEEAKLAARKKALDATKAVLSAPARVPGTAPLTGAASGYDLTQAYNHYQRAKALESEGDIKGAAKEYALAGLNFGGGALSAAGLLASRKFPWLKTLGLGAGISAPAIESGLSAVTSNIKEAIESPGTFHSRALANLRKQVEERPEEVGMSWVGGGVGGLGRIAAPKGSFAKGGSTTPAWQRKEGQNPEGGLNAAGRASYHAETGGTLKPPQPEGGPRRDSFCARMKGAKEKLTSAETARDPDSRINKALRKWNC